jgi:hypothetical protein
MTDDTEETIKKTGLRQIQVLQDDSNTGLRGTNLRKYNSIAATGNTYADDIHHRFAPGRPNKLPRDAGLAQALAR